MNRLDRDNFGSSKNIVDDNIEKLKEIFPDVFSEEKIDFEKLREKLGEFVDTKQERYNFTWHGKTKAKKIAQKTSTGTLRPDKEESKDWDDTENLYIEGDNLEVLKLLQKSYHNKVKMIYIDPPYNTGNDFVYQDDFKDNLQNYLELTGQVDEEGNRLSTNAESDGKYHSNWLNMMYPRLKLARNLLKEDGVIFISIGQDELNNLNKICDEIFGSNNMISIISRVMKSGGNKGTFFSPNIDYILVYAKNINKVSPFRADLGDELIEKVYNYTEKSGKRKGQNFRVMGLYQAGLDVRPNQRYWIKCPDDSFVIPPGDTYPSTVKEGNKITPNDGDGVWRWTYPRYKKELEKNNILFKKTNRSSLIDKNGNSSKWNVYTKIWLKDRMEDGKVPVNLISKFENRHSSQELKDLDIPFSFAKPVGLIKYLMKIVDIEDNEVVLDFFSGSGTTAHAVMKQNIEEKENIKFIMVQLPEPTPENSDARKAGFKTISDIGKERIRRGGEKLNEENKDNDNIENLDIGFKVFKLDSSNLKTWDVSLEDDLEQNLFDMVDNIKDDRAEEDILYEVLLKYGLDLTLPIEKLEIKNKSVYVIGFGALVICLDKEIDLELVEEIGKLKEKYQPEIMRVVFKDSGFKNDVVKTNAIQILEKYNIDDVKSL